MRGAREARRRRIVARGPAALKGRRRAGADRRIFLAGRVDRAGPISIMHRLGIALRAPPGRKNFSGKVLTEIETGL
jgi:hypothetical protein